MRRRQSEPAAACTILQFPALSPQPQLSLRTQNKSSSKERLSGVLECFTCSVFRDSFTGILFLLQRLAEGAEAAGGAVYVLNGACVDLTLLPQTT